MRFKKLIKTVQLYFKSQRIVNKQQWRQSAVIKTCIHVSLQGLRQGFACLNDTH